MTEQDTVLLTGGRGTKDRELGRKLGQRFDQAAQIPSVRRRARLALPRRVGRLPSVPSPRAAEEVDVVQAGVEQDGALDVGALLLCSDLLQRRGDVCQSPVQPARGFQEGRLDAPGAVHEFGEEPPLEAHHAVADEDDVHSLEGASFAGGGGSGAVGGAADAYLALVLVLVVVVAAADVEAQHLP